MNQPPVIDISRLSDRAASEAVAREIDSACRETGFFYVAGHGVDSALVDRLDALSRQFFAGPPERKREIAMSRGGRAWRGWFAVGDELTSGQPDQKEGIYFGEELDESDARVRTGTPLHGPNLFPDIPGFRDCVLEYIDAMRALGHRLLEGFSLALGLERQWFREHYTRDPLILFRIFNYPPLEAGKASSQWSVGEHTDYGLLTILRQDASGGLEVRSGGEWIDARPIPGTFVCNLGDMLDRMTSGRYRSTPHRVRNPGATPRLSFPFFFDPGWDAEIRPLERDIDLIDDAATRWDQTSVHLFRGTWGEYLLGKVSKVFPELGGEVL